MPRFVQLPADYATIPADTDDGLDAARGVVIAALINGIGVAIVVLLWFLWSAA